MSKAIAQISEPGHRLLRLVRIWVDGGFSGAEFLPWVMDTS